MPEEWSNLRDVWLQILVAPCLSLQYFSVKSLPDMIAMSLSALQDLYFSEAMWFCLLFDEFHKGWVESSLFKVYSPLKMFIFYIQAILY